MTRFWQNSALLSNTNNTPPHNTHSTMTERMPKGKAWVGVDMAAGPDETRLLILDRRIGQTMLLPCRHLPGRFLAHQNTR